MQVPDTKECDEYFGLSSNQNKARAAVATASALYDVLNNIIIDARITKFRTSEKFIARQHIESMEGLFCPQKSIFIFNRGYPSYDMFDYLNSKGLLFLMRTSTYFKLVQSIKSVDSILKYKVKGETKEVRIIKVKFSGTKSISIEQDFYASIYLSMVGVLLKKEADISIANDNKNTLTSTPKSFL